MQNKARSPILGAATAAIGRASNSLVPAESDFSHTFEVEVDHVVPDPAQPRRAIEAKALMALGETLQQQGQLQPILVRHDPAFKNKWIIVAGERRWRAAKLIGWVKLLAIAHERDSDVATLLENLQRVDLSPIEEANGIRKLVTEKRWTQEQAGHALGKTKSDISGILRILTIADDILSQVLTSEPALSKNVLVELARIEDKAALRHLAALAQGGGLTIRAIRMAREGLPTASTKRAARPPSIDPAWATLAKATDAVGRLADQELVVNPQQARTLRALREAIDRVLLRNEAAH